MKRPALYILVPLCLGIGICPALHVPILYAVSAGFLLAAVSIFTSARNTVSHAALYLAIFCLGISLYQNSNMIPADHIANLVSGGEGALKAELRGTIADDPYEEEAFYGSRKISFLLKTDAFRRSGRWEKARGLAKVNIYTKRKTDIDFGDEIVVEGVISRPAGFKNPGLFDYARYLANNNIYCILKSNDKSFIEVMKGAPANPVRKAAYKIREGMRSVLDRYLDGPDAAFAKAMLIGDRSGLGREISDEFVKTGTVHILSISGLHVGLIAGLSLLVLGLLRIPKKINLGMTVAFLAVYSYVAGSSPPIVRAVLMFSVFALGYIIERQTDLLNSLALAALLMLIWEPKELFDPGFQLSFVSIANIFIFTPKIEDILKVKQIAESIAKNAFLRNGFKYISGGVSVSIAAWVGTWPIISSYFNIVSPVSVIANLVVIPMSFASMIMSIIAICASPISGIFSGVVAHGLGIFDNVLFAMNRALSQIPIAYFRTPAMSWICMAAYYGLVIAWIFPSDRFSAGRVKVKKSAVAITALILFNAFVWEAYAGPSGGLLKMTFLDVGKGDSAFIEFPDGGNMLIDAGSGEEGGRLGAGRNVVAPYLWNELAMTIDTMMITHSHEDHLGGAIYLLNNFKVGTVIDNGAGDGSRLYEEYLRLIKNKGVRHIIAGAGDGIVASDSAKIFLLSPDEERLLRDPNTGSIVGKFVYKKCSVLFTGDATSEAMSAMIEKYGTFLRSDIMKTPHHGGNVGNLITADRFFSIVSPDILITSSGARERDHSVDISVAADRGLKKFDTRYNGAVILYITPTGYKTEPFIKNN